jgi:hypothetical protein
MRKVREGLADFFKMINLLMKEFQPKEGDWGDWQAFEGASEEATYLLCRHIMKALKCTPETMSGQRRVNPLIQKARAEQGDEIFAKQEIPRRLMKVKAMLDQFDRNHEDNAAD